MVVLTVPPVAARAAALGFVLVLSACIDIQESDKKKAATDSAAASSSAPPAAPAGTTPTTTTLPTTSTSAGAFDADLHPTVVRRMPPEIAAALRSDSITMLTERDSSLTAAPTASDLTVLQRELGIPLAGVPASALRDTYEEMRGGGTRTHEALDILAPRGTPVLSAANGRVLKLFNSKAGGLMVYAADSSEHFILMYGHLDAYAPGLVDGQPLRRGQQLGTVGTSGNAAPTVPHLHFAIARSTDVKQWWKGAPVNPYPLLVPAAPAR
jgi:murein DD-endopeptidase MepM/ murein hydrolase activator NlpD